MSFNDSNIRGFVHGGTVLQLLEEAACLAANKYCNTSPEGRKAINNNYAFHLISCFKIILK